MAEPIRNRMGALAPKLAPNWAGAFIDFNDWVNRASSYIGEAYCPLDECGHPQRAVCVDSAGRRCQVGGDFQRARDENTFPIYYFWNCESR